MGSTLIKYTVLLAATMIIFNHLDAQVSSPISDMNDEEHDTIPFRDMPWMHYHPQVTIISEKPFKAQPATEAEVKQYLYDCLSPHQIVILTNWINYLKEHGLPEDDSQYAGVKIHLLPATYKAPLVPKAAVNVAKKK
jgi:hypothetical protein